MSQTTLADIEAPAGRRDRSWPWVVALVLGGMLLSVLPHLINVARRGDAGYVADGDGLLYLAWSRDIVRHGGWSMTDAIHRPSGPMMHAWILFVPEAMLAHVIGVGMTGLGVIWRLLGGAALALGLYAVVRPFAKSPRGASALAAFLLFDAGFLLGQIGQRDVEILRSLAIGSSEFFQTVPRLMAHLRAPTPSLAIPFLLVHYALTHRARRMGTTTAAIAAGVSLGWLFHVYFYYATAAFAGTALAWVLDRGGRRTYAIMIGVGLLVAAPALIAGAWIKAETPPDWLRRTNKLIPVSRFDRARLLLPKVLIAEWLASAWFVFRSRRDLLYLWACTGAGLALANQQVITGRELENFHWTYAYGVTFSLLLGLLIAPWLTRRRGGIALATAIVVVQVVVGFGFRGVEVSRSAETNLYRDVWSRWKSERFAIPPGSVVAGPTNVLFCLGALGEVYPLTCRLVEFSSAATDIERDERLVLNAILIGNDREATAIDGESLTEATKAARRSLFDEIAADPAPWVARYGVTRLLLPAGRSFPAPRAGLARLVAKGQFWDLWTVEAADSQ
jgi:hypothetical protein